MIYITVGVRNVIPVRVNRGLFEAAVHWCEVCGKANLTIDVVTGFKLNPRDANRPGKQQVTEVMLRVNKADRVDVESEGTRTYTLLGTINDKPVVLTATYKTIEGFSNEKPGTASLVERR